MILGEYGFSKRTNPLKKKNMFFPKNRLVKIVKRGQVAVECASNKITSNKSLGCRTCEFFQEFRKVMILEIGS